MTGHWILFIDYWLTIDFISLNIASNFTVKSLSHISAAIVLSHELAIQLQEEEKHAAASERRRQQELEQQQAAQEAGRERKKSNDVRGQSHLVSYFFMKIVICGM